MKSFLTFYIFFDFFLNLNRSSSHSRSERESIRKKGHYGHEKHIRFRIGRDQADVENGNLKYLSPRNDSRK